MSVVLFEAAFHGKSPFPSQAGKGLSTPYKEIGQQKSAVQSQTEHIYRFSLTLYGAWQSPQNESDSLRLLD